MILAYVARGKKWMAGTMLAIIYLEMIIPTHLQAAVPVVRRLETTAATPPAAINVLPYNTITTPFAFPKKAVKPAMKNADAKKIAGDIGGPTQPEMQAFHAAGNENMVDLFSGDFSYSIPLLDVGGYPVTIGYNSGISMDQEASWVGLGWNINPGSITRNLRGIPDDFNGKDSITKELTIKENKTVGVTGGIDLEITGAPLSLGFSLGVFKNTYKGWGLETGVNAGLSVGDKAKGSLTAGLSVSNNSQNGLAISPSLGIAFPSKEAMEKGGYTGSVSIGTSYNSRSGLSALQLSGGVRAYSASEKIFDDKGKEIGLKPQKGLGSGTNISSHISFAHPGYSPTIHIPYTNTNATVTLKMGGLVTVVHPAFYISGYVSTQKIAAADRRLSLPAFGYLNYQSANGNRGALLDFNREKDIPYREKPAVPNIAIPSYTYDIFSMSGEGIGGSFRAYRNDIGYVYDHEMTTRDASGSFSADIGGGFIVHGGVDINYTRSFTKSALWENDNPLRSVTGFRKTDKAFEAAYFRSPGEKTINATTFYDAMGGDNVVTPRLFQQGALPIIKSTTSITPFKNGIAQPDITLTNANTVKPAREKRTQSITYLTAKEASEVGLSKYIENYAENTFTVGKSTDGFVDEFYGNGDGLIGRYYNNRWFGDWLGDVHEANIDFQNRDYFHVPNQKKEQFALQLFGRLKVPVSGTYLFKMESDDGNKLRMRDEWIIDDSERHSMRSKERKINLEGGQMYDIQVDYFQDSRDAALKMSWKSDALGPNTDYQIIPPSKFFTRKDIDAFPVNGGAFMREKRLNAFRKADHISEIDVLNNDGRRYVYGIPVYNLQQKETTFSVEKKDAVPAEGLVNYTAGVDDGFGNKKGNDWYYTADSMPPYAHSYLLTGILSPNYVDITGDGISDDDAGNAIRFNYTRTAGIKKPFLWRAPYSKMATYNEGMKTDNRDDKGSYVSGGKEVWYLNAIESKSMVAFFTLDKRSDLLQIDAMGRKTDGGGRLLKQIDLYTKADYLKNGTKAKPVKTVHFRYDYTLCPGVNNDGVNGNTGGKLTLKEIWFSYNGNEKGKKNAYRFNYNKLNPSYTASKYDRWGNYKDPLQNPGSNSGNLISNSDYPYALQDSTLAASNAAAWGLDSIEMPSGGRLKIDYESDDYAYVQNKRAMQMCKVAGFSSIIPTGLQYITNQMYDHLAGQDYMYVSINVPYAVKSNAEVYARYLEGVSKIYFRLLVGMPADKFGSGSEFVSCYAGIDPNGGYGFYNGGKTIWVKLTGIDKKGNEGGNNSPLVKAAMQFLKLNLPSKAYPGSDEGEDMGIEGAVKILQSQVDNIKNTINSFENNARPKRWAQSIDTSRSVARLTNPYLKKYGGGLRVKRIVSYNYWNKMTGQRGATYGKEYDYTTTKVVNGETLQISSGVAAYEPIMGGEENPWHMPIEYQERVSVLAPVNLGYTEEPLGESFFPSPSVGYSKVRVRTINAKKNRSANGYDESCFYTTKDFPTITERTTINGETKKRYKNPLQDLLRVNSQHFLAVSQGFKIEINDMNGKLRSQASYAETDPDHWITYSENFYRVDNQQSAEKHLNNKVQTISPKGVISNSEIGKDMELMLDMREERSLTNGVNLSVNADFFTVAIWPILVPSLIPLPQREENIFRSVAATKVINRHGIIDSVLAVDKGSKVVTHNLLYDEESGEPVLTSVQNEYNDRIYNYTYPAAWIYEGMAGAYKNVGVVLNHIDIKEGRIIGGLTGSVNDYFFSGDEILAYAKRKVAGTDCAPEVAYWPASFKVWAVNANMLKGGAPDIYFINQDGSPLTGSDVTLKIVRSGRRNIAAAAGSVTMLNNPLIGNQLVLNDNSGVIDASVTEFKEFWKVPDRKVPAIIIDTFRNAAMTDTFNVTCGTNTQRIPVTVAANKFSSVVSQRMADEIAKAYLEYSGPGIARQQVPCNFYYSKKDSAYFTKSCTSPAMGDKIKYVLKPGADSSLVSQAAADALAQARLQTEGQAYANSKGGCYYNNEVQSGPFTRDNCPPGTTGSTVTYTLPVGTDTSYTSIAAANSKTRIKLNAGGPQYARDHGECSYFARLTIINQVTNVVPNPVGGRNNSFTKGDVVISFYEDEACTIPRVVNNLAISLKITEEFTQGGANTAHTFSDTFKPDTVNGSSKVLMLQTTIRSYTWEWLTEGGREPHLETRIENTFSIVPNSAFVIK